MSDVDGDGYGVWFGAGDCAPWSGKVSPRGREILGDGVDSNCMAGDPSVQQVAQLQRALAGDNISSEATPKVDRILLITVDALRSDSALPQLWSLLGHRCRVFSRAYAASHATTDSIYTLLRGRFSARENFTTVGDFLMPMHDPAPNLPELLTAGGYETAAFVFHHRFDPRMMLTRGFDRVWTAEARREIIQGIAAPTTLEQASRWLAQAPDSWFLWVHLYDPHAPYLDHEGRPRVTARQAYDSEVAFTDAIAARWLEGLKYPLEDIAVVLTADHGEAFAEHGTVLHANTMFEEELRVPLWICPPGDAREQVDVPVSAVDIAPTILDWANVARPPSFIGRSLLGSVDSVPVYAKSSLEAAPIQVLVVGSLKLIRQLSSDAYALFDLAQDPDERFNLAAHEDQAMARMQVELDRILAVLAAPYE